MLEVAEKIDKFGATASAGVTQIMHLKVKKNDPMKMHYLRWHHVLNTAQKYLNNDAIVEKIVHT